MRQVQTKKLRPKVPSSSISSAHFPEHRTDLGLGHLGPQVSRATSRSVRLTLRYEPFVGLWDLPRYPAGAASCTFPPHRQVLRVDLTAFPGLPRVAGYSL